MWKLIAIILTVYIIATVIFVPQSQKNSEKFDSSPGIGGAPPEAIEEEPVGDSTSNLNTIEALESKGTFSILLESLRETGFVGRLAGPEQFTLLAPTDEAFTKIPPEEIYPFLTNRETLRVMIGSHIIQGSLENNDFSGKSSIGTLEGGSVRIDYSQGLSFNSNKVIGTIKTSNGIIYIINNLILPPDFLIRRTDET